MDGRDIVMLSVFIIVEGVIPIGVESGEICFICFGELYRAEDVVPNREIVVVCILTFVLHRERIDISSRLHIGLQSREQLIR